jgi:hypothetical protein
VEDPKNKNCCPRNCEKLFSLCKTNDVDASQLDAINQIQGRDLNQNLIAFETNPNHLSFSILKNIQMLTRKCVQTFSSTVHKRTSFWGCYGAYRFLQDLSEPEIQRHLVRVDVHVPPKEIVFSQVKESHSMSLYYCQTDFQKSNTLHLRTTKVDDDWKEIKVTMRTK